MFSGVNGQELEADIFIGVVYYQRLRHMVSDKFQVHKLTGLIFSNGIQNSVRKQFGTIFRWIQKRCKTRSFDYVN